MASIPLVAIETPTGNTGSDGLAVFTFGADIDTTNHRIVVDRLEQGNTIDYTVTGARQVTFIAGSIPVTGARVWLFNGVAGVTTVTSLPSWPTVASVISDAAVELGLISADIADPFGSVDPNVLQLLRLLKSGGRDMVSQRPWTHLNKEFTFNLANAVQGYPLPADFRSMIDDSGWDRTTRFPFRGPVDSETWQFLQAVPIASNIVYNFRIWQSRMYVVPTPGNVTDTMAYEYNGSSWVKPVGQQQPTSDAPSVATDIVCFDARLVVARLKRDFRRNKKQDSQSEEQDYQDAMYDAENEDAQGRTIYLGGRSSRTPRKIDRWNLPDTIT